MGGGLGVKNLKNFNISMLAKQGWPLLNNSNPLVSAIMKAKYYPKTDFLNAEMGGSPNYIWRSMLAAKDAIKASCRRRIGDGASTYIWKVPWLPDSDDGFVSTSMPMHLREAKVQNLINMEGRNWDAEVLRDIFNERDVALINRIPIPVALCDDSWFWLRDEKGKFTVGSHYRWLQGEQDVVHSNFWKKLWLLKMPGKVTNFLWRVCKGCLPTSSALVMKKVNINENCPWCHNSKETDMHVLFQCDFARTVWQMADIQLMHLIMPHESVFDVLRRFFDGCSRDQCVRLSMYCWSIWNRRNKWVWDKANGSAFGVKSATMNLLHDWKEAQKVQVQYQIDRREIVDKKWIRPPESWFKINVDATGAHNGYIGIGCVIRDSQGHFIGAKCSRVTGNWTPKEAEALSLKEALMWTKQLQLDCCILETDSQTLALACYGEDGSSYFNTIVSDCKLELKHFNHVLVKFVFSLRIVWLIC